MLPFLFTTQLASALSRKEKGNAAYKAGRLARAARQYSAAVEAANSIQERDLSPNPAGDADGEWLHFRGFCLLI